MLRRPLLLALAALAASAATAQADTYCVASPTCAAKPGGHAAADLPAAIAAAGAHAGADRIELGAGTFPFPGGGTPTVGTGNDITEIVGAGRDATILTGGSAGQFALAVEHAGTIVSDLGVALPANVDSMGLKLDGAGIVARRVDVEGPQSTGSSEGVGITGGATLDDARVVLPLDVAAAGVYVYGSGGATLTGATVTAGYPLRVNSTNGTTTVSRSHISGSYRVAYIQEPNELVISDSLLESTSGAYEAVGVDAGTAGKTTTARITRSTLVSKGGHSLVDVTSYTSGATARAILRGVALVGTDAPFGRSAVAGGTAFVDVDYSAFRTGYAPGPSDAFGGHNVGAPSGFVAPAQGDYRVRFDSPLVDAAGIAPLPPIAKDLDGGTRTVDGKGDGGAQVDIGAFEYQRRAPTFTATASTGAALPGTPISFLMSDVTDPDPGEVPKLRWDFSDGSTIAGAAAQHAFAEAPGGITATAVATDPAGVTTSKPLHVEIVPTGTGKPGGGDTTNNGTPPTGQPGGPNKPGSTVRVARLRVGSDGRLRLRVTCSGAQACRGRVAIRTKAAKGRRALAVASAPFTLKAGASRTLVLKLGRKGRAAVPKGKRVRLTATATGQDATGAALEPVTLAGTVRRR